MKNLRFSVFILSFIALNCGGGDDNFKALNKPVDIALATQDLTFRNEKTNFAYVVDQFTQAVSLLDTRRHEFADTAEDDELDFTPIPIGGEPIAIAVDNGITPHRFFVADQLSKQIIAYQIQSSIPQNAEVVTYSPVSLGGVKEGKSSRPVFKDVDAVSSPTITSIVVDPTKAKNESWRVRFRGDNKYEVRGTKSGLQNGFAKEGTTYTTDDESVEFFISAGGEKTTEGDQFFFGTYVTRPLQLTDTPVDVLVNGRNLYVLTRSTPSIIVINLNTLDVESTTAIPDANAIPTNMFFYDDTIYTSNINSGDVFAFDTSSPSFTTISTGLSNVKFVAAQNDRLLLLSDATASLSIWNITDAEIEKTITFDDYGNFIFISKIDNVFYAYIPNVAGNVDVVNLSTLKRVDTELDDKQDYINQEFFDVSPQSSPQLINVSVKPNKGHTESWQMIYEGIIPNVLDLSGSISGDQLTDAEALFQTYGVQAGDMLIRGNSEIEIESVESETSLTLKSTPSFQGNITYDVRAKDSYVMIGSKSGIQNNRVIPGVTYETDGEELTLKTRPSFDKPETRGDFFTFGTLDPIDPILISGESMAVGGIGLVGIADNRPTGFILESATGRVASVDLRYFDVLEIF